MLFTAGAHAASRQPREDTLMFSPTGAKTRREVMQRSQVSPGGRHIRQIVLSSPGQHQCISGATCLPQLPAPGQQGQFLPQSAGSGYHPDPFQQLLHPTMATYPPTAALISAQPQSERFDRTEELEKRDKLLCRRMAFEVLAEQAKLGALSMSNTATPGVRPTRLARQQVQHQQAQSTHAMPNTQSVSQGVPKVSTFTDIETYYRWYADPGYMRVSALSPQQMEESGDTSWRQGLDKRRMSELRGNMEGIKEHCKALLRRDGDLDFHDMVTAARDLDRMRSVHPIRTVWQCLDGLRKNILGKRRALDESGVGDTPVP